MYIYLVYFDIEMNGKAGFKTFIRSENKTNAKLIFQEKIKRDFKKIKCSNIRIYKIQKKSYRGRYIDDINWDWIDKYSYPNNRHKLIKIKKNSWFRKKRFNNRNPNGTFKKGFTPWNKGLKISFYKKNVKGKFEPPRNNNGLFKKGVKYKVLGCKVY